MGFFWSVMCNTIVPAAVEDERGGERGDKSAGPVITEASKRGGGGDSMAPIPLLSAGEDGPRLGKDGTMRRDRGVVACSRSPGMLHRFRPSILSLSLSFHFVSFRRESKDFVSFQGSTRGYIYIWNSYVGIISAVGVLNMIYERARSRVMHGEEGEVAYLRDDN